MAWPMLVVYDQFPGGIGLSAELFNSAEEVMRESLDVIQNLRVQRMACPACVGPAGENGVGGKETARGIIKQLLNMAG